MLIAYYRVSTAKQGRSGLGLDAQRQTVAEFAARQNDAIVAEYTEVESGKRTDRPQLLQALADCKSRPQCVLVVAKLDRLARNVHFTSTVMSSGVAFVACDNPNANRLTIHILAAVAEYELEMISTRLKEAFRQAKLRGRKLGAANPRCRGKRTREELAAISVLGVRERQRRAAEFSAALRPIAASHRDAGQGAAAIAAILAGAGYRTKRGCPWRAWNILQLLAEEPWPDSLLADCRGLKPPRWFKHVRNHRVAELLLGVGD